MKGDIKASFINEELYQFQMNISFCSLRNYYSFTYLRWPNGRIPYTIDKAFNQTHRLIIAQGKIIVN